MRALLGSSFLTGGFLLVNIASVAPAYAVPCDGAANGPNATACINGSSAMILDYVDDNPDYVGGDFELLLRNFDVNAAGMGIFFSEVIGGDGTIILQDDSDVVAGGGLGIGATAGNGSITIDIRDTSSVTGAERGIEVSGGSGAVTVTTAAGSAVAGNAGTGIMISSDGVVTVNAQGSVTGNGLGVVDGIFVQTDGVVDVTTGPGAVTGTDDGIDSSSSASVSVTTGTGSVIGFTGNGIDATASGNVTVNARNVFGTVNGINAASSAGGNVNVTTGGVDSFSVSALGGAGINASATAAGTITITNSTFVVGSVAAIVASSVTGSIQITNTALLRNTLLSPDSLVIKTTGGPTTITNNGIIVGRVETGAGADVLDNNVSGLISGWATRGDSDFGAGIDVVNNNAFLVVASREGGPAEMTNFLNLETLNNNGIIAMADQIAGDGSNISDRLQTFGDYNGINDARILVDAFLGAAGSLSDVMAVGGSTSGTTFIVVNNTNAGPGAFNPTGILVVDVGGGSAADDFALAGGPIDTGLFFYDLLFDEAAGEHRLFGLPDREAFETLAVVSGSQEIWRETADAWSTRQENLRDMLASSRIVTGVADPAVPEREAPGNTLWVSMLGAWAERDDDASFALLNGNFNFDMSYKQQIYGFVGGADFRTGIGEDGSLLFGLLGGYVDSKLDFDEGSTSIDSKGGTLGAYASLLGGGFFADILVKADLLKVDYTAGGLGADDNDTTDATSIGARGDFGYRFGDTLFVEPMISLDAISTRIDDFSIGGADVDAGTNESFRGGAGLRVGYGSETIRASATARVWDVFATDNEVDILSAGPALGLSDSDLEGVYGDVSGQVDIDLSSSTTLYLKGGVLFSDDVTKPNASGGFAFYW